MKERGVSSYALKVKAKIGGSTYNRLRADMPISTHTIDILCGYLDCEVQDILVYVGKKEQEGK